MIVVQNITKQFGKLKALDDVSVQCNSGECVLLIGPNGSGKTTLIKSILGMVIPNSGTIFFNKKDIATDWTYRAKIGYMPQIGRYPDNMTIGHVLEMMKDIRGNQLDKLDEDLIDAFKLKAFLNKRMCTLSGGTMQKVSAALAFLFNPDVLILDEPTASLDAETKKVMSQLIETVMKDKTIIMVTHDDFLMKFANKKIEIGNGRIIGNYDTDTAGSDGLNNVASYNLL